MNYLEQRLMELKQQINVLECRKDAQNTVEELKQERQEILNYLKFNK